VFKPFLGLHVFFAFSVEMGGQGPGVGWLGVYRGVCMAYDRAGHCECFPLGDLAPGLRCRVLLGPGRIESRGRPAGRKYAANR